MIGKSASVIFQSLLNSKSKGSNSDKQTFKQIVRQIANYPAKLIAAFFSAPILIVNIALRVKNPIRKTFAICGIIFSLILSYLAATFLGTVVGAIFIASSLGLLAGIGFLLGTSISIVLSVAFSYLIFTSTAFVFLQLSTEEVALYLEGLSMEGKHSYSKKPANQA